MAATHHPGDTALRITATVLALVLVSMATFVPLSQNDFWLQAAIGKIIVETGEIPHTVMFPFTWAQNNLFYAHEWLPSIAFHLLNQQLGYERLLFVQGALGLALYGLCFVLAFRVGRSSGLAILFACMAMAVANYRHFLRPEIFALILFVLQMLALAAYRLRNDRRILLWCLPIAIVWANSHGSFFVGAAVAALFALGEAIEAARRSVHQPMRQRLVRAWLAGAPYAAAALGMLVVSLINPLGIGLFHFVQALTGSEVAKTYINEWRPTLSSQFIRQPVFVIFAGCAALTLGVAVALRRRLTATDVLLLAAFFVLALTRLRYVVWFGFVSMLVCARLFGAGAWRPAWERAALGIAVLTSAVGVALVFRFGNAYGAYPYHVSTSDFTKPMVEQLSRTSMHGNVLTSYELGAELIYRFYPRLRPSLDSRIDSYGDDYYVFHQRLLLDGPLLHQFASDFDVRYLLLSGLDFQQLEKTTEWQNDWRVQFSDKKAVLLARTPFSLLKP